MIPSKIKIESFAKRCRTGTLGGKGLKQPLHVFDTFSLKFLRKTDVCKVFYPSFPSPGPRHKFVANNLRPDSYPPANIVFGPSVM